MPAIGYPHHPALIPRALLAVLAKRGVMQSVHRERLRRRLVEAEVTDLPGLRRFLASDRIRPEVGRTVAAMLAPHDDQVIGGFHLIAPLAKGGMGTIWMTTHGDELAVLKLLNPTGFEADELRRRFEREATITAALDHPHTVRCLGHGYDRGIPWMALAFVDGGDAANMIRQRGAVPETDAVSVVVQALRGLMYAWDRGLVHRDIKPANLFITLDGRVLVGDFGLAKPVATPDSGLTAKGNAVGSPAYMAPEQIRALDLDWRADLYALGCVLHELLTGKPPFSGSLSAVMTSHLTDPPPPMRLPSPCGPDLAAFIQQAMEKDRQRRHPSPKAALAALLTIGERLDGASNHGLSRASIDASTTYLIPKDAPATVEPAPTVAPAPVTVTVATPAAPAPAAPVETMGNDLSDTFRGDWQLTVPTAAPLRLRGEGWSVEAVAGMAMTLGSSPTGPGAVPLVDPANPQPGDERISRMHVVVRVDDGGTAIMTDPGSRNGIEIDGRLVDPQIPVVLAPGNPVTVQIPGAAAYAVRCLPKRTRALPLMRGQALTGPSDSGLGSACPIDSVVWHRPGAGWALVVRRCLIGDEAADIPIPGWSGPNLEIAHWQGRWIQRRGAGAWEVALSS